jgi:nicotinate-nucleotide pyrophosphorylase (carboxylating)
MRTMAKRKQKMPIAAAHDAALFGSIELAARLRGALVEDLGVPGDVTSQALVPADRRAKAVLLAKAEGVLCGVHLVGPVFQIAGQLVAAPHDVPWRITLHKGDGDPVCKGEVAAALEGPARALLAGERTVLNLVSHLSGIATQTAEFVKRIKHTRAMILDTRKTTPLWRDLEKFAVKCGGGENHRRGLFDMVLIKDNHLALWGQKDPAGAVNTARARCPGVPIEVEVVDLAGLKNVCENSTPEMILLDNHSREDLAAAVQWCRGFYREKKRGAPPLLEASGGVTLENVAAIADTGVDRISIGALTHSVKALDFSLELEM